MGHEKSRNKNKEGFQNLNMEENLEIQLDKI